MKNIVAVTSSSSAPIAQMAAEALKKVATLRGDQITVETAAAPLTAEAIQQAALVILAVEQPVATQRFAGKPVYGTSPAEAIRHTEQVLQAADALIVPAPAAAPTAPLSPPETPAPVAIPAGGLKFVAITACPTGIAHTFMAAEALQKAAKALGHTMKVETQGSVGAKNQLTDEDIAAADAVIVAAETKVDLSRFAGKRLYLTSTKHALHNGQEVLKTALEQPVGSSLASSVEQAKADRSKQRTGPYKHLMTGVSYMLPLVIAGGLAIALAFAVGGINASDQPGTLAAALSLIGGGTAFHLFVAVLSGFIAFSIADRPGIAPGLIGGMLAQSMGAGFLGGIASGFLAGYLTKFLADRIKLPATLEGLKPVLILPFLSSIIVGLLMIYVIAPPVKIVLVAMTEWLNAMQGTNAVVLGLILGAMMAFDMGGPINKAAYTFGVGLLASKVEMPMAAIMAGGMTPPLGLALAAWFFKNRFDVEEREAAGPAFVLGLAFITEGAIPFAAKDPLRVIPALVVGAAVAGGLSMAARAELLVPHGGIFAILIPGAVTHLLPYLGAIAAGALTTTAMLFFTKKKILA